MDGASQGSPDRWPEETTSFGHELFRRLGGLVLSGVCKKRASGALNASGGKSVMDLRTRLRFLKRLGGLVYILMAYKTCMTLTTPCKYIQSYIHI